MPAKRKLSFEMRKISRRNTMRRSRTTRNQQASEFLASNDLTITQMNEAIKFDREISQITYVCCDTCHRAFPDIILNNAGLCQTCKSTEGALKFSAANSMDPGPVPNCLKDLSYIEQMMIAQIHPVVSLYRIRGSQYGYSGNVISFKQNIETFISRLPINPSDMTSTVLVTRNTLSGCAEFSVRSQRILEALGWLKAHNPYYSNIIIDEDLIATLPENGDVSQMLPTTIDFIEDIDTLDEEVRRESFRPLLEPVHQNNLINDAIRIPHPSLNSQPVNEFQEDGYIARAFPHLFPHGTADLRQPRLKSVSPDEYFKFLMKYKDGRFAKDPRFRYFAMNSVLRWQSLAKGRFFVQRNKFTNKTVEQMRDILNRKPEMAKHIMIYASKLRSTKGYWRARCGELLSMVGQIGTPTIFFTLSAADYHWPDLFRLLESNKDPNELTDAERRQLMHDNPLLTGWLFQKRCDIFLKKILVPLFLIDDYWVRFEWQWRGSPHMHGLLWLKGAPNVETLDMSNVENVAAVTTYFDKLCSAVNPDKNVLTNDIHRCRFRFSDISNEDREKDLAQLLNQVQRHTKHGEYCLRKKRGTNSYSCRFGFPKAECDSSKLQEENGIISFLPKRNDPEMNTYNCFVSQVWRANTDFSPITSKDAVLHYIAKYASKSESPSAPYKELLSEILNKMNETNPAIQAIQKLILSSVSERDYSAQEVVHILMGWPMYHSSREVVTIRLHDNNWEEINFASDERPSKSMVQKYCDRPERLASCTLLTFAKSFSVKGVKYRQRRKDAVVRVFPLICNNHDPTLTEEYYKQQVLLNCPWRGNSDSLLQEGLPSVYQSWEEAFNELSIDTYEEMNFPAVSSIHEPEMLQEEYREVDPYMAAAAIIPVQTNEEALGQRVIDHACEWKSENYNYPNHDFTSFLNYCKEQQLTVHQNYDNSNIVFTDEQQKILHLCTEQLSSLQTSVITCPKRTFISGKAGAGKSTVIKEIRRRVTEHLGPEAIMILAPTGAAAINVEGKTIHSALKIPMCLKSFADLGSEAARNLQLSMDPVSFLIIDEFSMIGCRLMAALEQRCREGKPASNEPFGGLFVYLIGDIRQLQPVKDIPLYKSYSIKDILALRGQAVLRTFEKCFTLTKSMRQSDDQQRQFREILDSLSVGQVTCDQYASLMQRRKAILSPADLERFQNAIRLFPTNKQTEEYNQEILRKSKSPVARILADHNNQIARWSEDDHASGLQAELFLAIGCRVMLRTNLWTEGGLVNGALGTVKDIVYGPGLRPPGLPQAVMVEFDDYKGPFLIEKLFPVTPISRSWKEKNVSCSRTQLPLQVAYAVTIHKSQGLTLSKIAVDIGPKELSLGATYVAFSRVRRLEDILIEVPFSKDRLEQIRRMGALADRLAFENYLTQMTTE